MGTSLVGMSLVGNVSGRERIWFRYDIAAKQVGIRMILTRNNFGGGMNLLGTLVFCT